MKIRVDELNVDKLVPVSVDLSKLTNALKMRLLEEIYIMLR